MALVLTEPFNNFTAAPWVTTGSPTIVTGRTGNGAQFTWPSGADKADFTIPSGSQTDTITLGFAWRPSPDTTHTRPFLSLLSDSGATEHGTLRLLSTGALEYRSGGSVKYTSSAGLLVANTWHYLEIQVKLHDTSGTLTILLNGTTLTNQTGIDTKAAGTKTVWDTIRLGPPTAFNGSDIYDDLYLRNDTLFQGDPTLGPVVTGTGAISFGGAGTATVALIYRPTGTGAINFAGSGAATVAFLGGTAVLSFDGRGTAKISPLIVTGAGHIDLAGRGDIDVAPHLDVYAPPEWSWLVLRPDGTPVGPLTAATARKLTLQLDGAATASFTMPGDHPQTATITELATDLYVARNGRALFRGRIGGSSETHAAASDTVNLTAVDYRGVLAHRLVWPTSQLEFAGVDQAEIAWKLIADTQALGDLRITRGVGGVTGIVRDRTYTAGIGVAQSIEGLAGVADGFDWEVDAHLAFNIFHPERGRYPADVPSSQPILTYGRDVVSVTTTVDPSKYANAIYFTGSGQTDAAAPADTSDPDIGRWELQKADPNATLQTTVDEEAAAELDDAARLPSAITVTLAADIWNPYVLWLGDLVRALITVGRLDLDVRRRIVQIDVALDDTGVETVALAIGATPPKLSDRLNNLQKQISQLQLAKPGGGGGGGGDGGGGGGGGGGGDGGIKEITSIGHTIVVTAPTGPITNLEVASGVGHIVVTSPTGPVVNLEYVAAPGGDTIFWEYEVIIAPDLKKDPNEFGFYSVPATSPWLLAVPPDEAGFVPARNTGSAIARITATGTYTLSVHVSTIEVATGQLETGDPFPIDIIVGLGGTNPWGWAGRDFDVGRDPPTTIDLGSMRVWNVAGPNYAHAAVHFTYDVHINERYWLTPARVALGVFLTRVP